jgi:hypothetical protein
MSAPLPRIRVLHPESGGFVAYAIGVDVYKLDARRTR